MLAMNLADVSFTMVLVRAPQVTASLIVLQSCLYTIRCAVENDRKHDDLCVGAMGYKTTMTNKGLASKHQKHQMEGSICI